MIIRTPDAVSSGVSLMQVLMVAYGVLQVAHCGICHSDLHQILNEWKNTKYPCLPGHEITGIVTEVGGSVSKFKVRTPAVQMHALAVATPIDRHLLFQQRSKARTRSDCQSAGGRPRGRGLHGGQLPRLPPMQGGC